MQKHVGENDDKQRLDRHIVQLSNHLVLVLSHQPAEVTYWSELVALLGIVAPIVFIEHWMCGGQFGTTKLLRG